MKAIIKYPGEPVGHYAEIENTLEALQEAVGGYIEAHDFIFSDAVMIINEEGRLLGLPKNCRVGDTMIVGPIVFVGKNDEEFADCQMKLELWKSALELWGNET